MFVYRYPNWLAEIVFTDGTVYLFVGGAAGIGTGILEKVKGAASLTEYIPAVQRKLCLWAIGAFTVFTLLATYPMIFSDFKMAGF